VDNVQVDEIEIQELRSVVKFIKGEVAVGVTQEVSSAYTI